MLELQEAGLLPIRAGLGHPCSVLGWSQTFLPFSPGNAGLLALADVFSEDSSSSLCQLDIRYMGRRKGQGMELQGYRD